MKLRAILTGLLVAGGLTAAGCGGGYVSTSGSYTTAGVVVYDPPPRPRVVVSPAPRPGFVYVQGRWDRVGARWVWRDGYWMRERVGYFYRPGRWERRGRGYVFVGGGWTARR